MSEDYTSWVARNPPPSIHDLVTKYGTFDRVPPAEWENYEHKMKVWFAAYRFRHEEARWRKI